MKSLANDLLKVAEGIFADYLLAYPIDAEEVGRDKKRLTLLVKERGLGVFTLDLPALDETLLRGLESSRLVLGCALSKKASPSTQVPRLFRGLWLRIFDVDGNLSEHVDPTAIAFLRQLCCIGKKIEVECSTKRRDDAIEEYFNVEKEIRRPSLNWEKDYLCKAEDLARISFDDYCGGSFSTGGCLEVIPDDRQPSSTRLLLRRLQRNADFFSEAIGKYDPYEFSNEIHRVSNGIGLRHGPGAVADQPQKGYKYDFPCWPAKLGRWFGYEQYGLGLPIRTGYQVVQPDLFGCSTRSSSTCGTTQLATVSPPLCYSREGPAHTLPFQLGENALYGSKSTFRDRSVVLSGHEAPARLLAVPKTAKSPRLIAAEPTAHQWCQQLTKRFLSDRLKGLFADNFICFENQGLSQELVSSASRVGHLATVDLSSASDRLSCAVVERVFRRNPSLLHALHAHRTRWLVTDKSISDTKQFLLLKKFASQGTAVTFPIQTIIFFLCAITASGFEAQSAEDFICNGRICNSIGRLRNKVRVYGDDIIIPSHGYDSLCELLHVLGLKVNLAKSFAKGKFRESCGMDCYDGYNVTPSKPKRISATGPQSRQAMIDCTNDLFKKGFWHAALVLESTLPRWVLANLPFLGRDCGGTGRFSYSGESFSHLRKRWNNDLHRYEIRTYSLKTSNPRTPINSPLAMIQYFTEAPDPSTNWKSGVAKRPKTRDGLRWEFPHYASVCN